MRKLFIIPILFVVFSCNKRTPNIDMYSGRWNASAPSCVSSSKYIDIEFVRVIGSKSKNRNKYCVKENPAFLCADNTGTMYYSDEFNFESVSEGGGEAEAYDGKSLTLKIKSDTILYVTCSNPEWKMSFKKSK